LREYTVKKPLPVREGKVGEQIVKETGEYRPGQGKQIELLIDKKDWKKYLDEDPREVVIYD